jgi:alpha-1,3-rhamnosyl/mannosyltransferase
MVELIRALLRREEGRDYVVFYTREATRAQIGHGAVARFHRVRPESAWLRATVTLPLAVRLSRVSLLHGQYGLPPLTDTPAVLTVHDVFVAENPEMYPLVHRLQLQYRIPRALKRARRVIVPSEFTKAEIVSRYGIDPVKIHVIPLGVSDRFQRLPQAQLQGVRDQLRLPCNFVLYVGALQPRKNLVRLVLAFAQLPAEMRRAYPLLIAGSHGWMNDELRRAALPILAEGTCRLLGYLSDEEVPAVMNLASVFAFPSLSEGFGFPAVEAMRCGACLLAGRAGSLPEIVGEAGMLVDPLDTQAMSRGLLTLLENPSLREDLRARGAARSLHYTWDRTASSTVAVYDDVLEECGSRRITEVPCRA